MQNFDGHTPRHVGDFALHVSSLFSDRVAFEIRRRVLRERVRYKDIPERMHAIIRFLLVHNVKPGDKVLIWAFNCPEYALLLLTLFSYGYVAVPIDHRTAPDTIARILDQTQPTALFHSRFITTASLNATISHAWILEDLFTLIANNHNHAIVAPEMATDIHATCQIVYTSGTTGVPKGVMLSQNNILQNTRALYPVIPEKHIHHRTISVLPLSHMFEQMVGLMAALSFGATVTYIPRVNSFQLRKAMQDVRPTYLALVPQLMDLFWRRIEEQAHDQGKSVLLRHMLNLASYIPRGFRRTLFASIHKTFGGSLRFIGCGGAPMNYHIGRNFVAMGIQLLEGYGATEVTALATVNDGRYGVGNVGKTVSGVTIRLDDQGQILIKSPCVSQGYFRNETKTKEVFQDGWYYTGDIGAIGPDGVLRVIGRDHFKIVLAGGEKVYVEDIERIALRHPAIQDICVLGVSHGQADMVHAVCIPKDPAHFEASIVIREINAWLESKQQIMAHSVWGQGDFPRTPTLKLNRKVIRDVMGGVLAPNDLRVTGNQSVSSHVDIMDLLAQISHIEKVNIQDSDVLASDLGLDSIDRGELVAGIEEHLGVVVDATRIDVKTTVADVKGLLSQQIKMAPPPIGSGWHYTWWGECVRLMFQYLVTFPFHALFVKLTIQWPSSMRSIPPGSLIVVNHVGVLDVACVWRILGNRAVKSISLARSTFWDNPVMGKFIEMVSGAIPLDQTGATIVPFLARAWDLLAEGRYLIMFPQGRMQRSKTQDKFKMGVGLVAKELKCPVVPVKLVGYEDVWPAPQVLFKDIRTMLPRKRGDVVAIVGDPIVYDSSQSATQITHVIETAFERLAIR